MIFARSLELQGVTFVPLMPLQAKPAVSFARMTFPPPVAILIAAVAVASAGGKGVPVAVPDVNCTR